MSNVILATLQRLALGTAITIGGCELLLNPSFESVPSETAGWGLLPDDWIDASNIAPGADTWSNDGSYGEQPGTPEGYNHFTGVVAQEGIRWVAGADFGHGVREGIAQRLPKSLTPGKAYTFSAYLCHTTVYQTNQDLPGGWEVYLSADGTFEPGAAVSMGKLDVTTRQNVWQSRSRTFTAPANAASLPYLVLVPYSKTPNFECYVGIDNIVLAPQSGTRTAVPYRLLEETFGIRDFAGTR